MLAAIGIVKGQPFTPDAHTREILDRAAKTAYKMSRVIGFQETSSAALSFRVYPDRRWINPMADATPANPGGVKNTSWMNVAGAYPGIWTSTPASGIFTNYYSVSPGMISQIPGKGAKYMIAFTDSEGSPCRVAATIA